MEARNQRTWHAQTESIRNHADNGEHERPTVIWIDFTLRTVLWNKFEFRAGWRRALLTKSLLSLFLASTFALHFAGYGVYDAKGANGGKGGAGAREWRWRRRSDLGDGVVAVHGRKHAQRCCRVMSRGPLQRSGGECGGEQVFNLEFQRRFLNDMVSLPAIPNLHIFVWFKIPAVTVLRLAPRMLYLVVWFFGRSARRSRRDDVR